MGGDLAVSTGLAELEEAEGKCGTQFFLSKQFSYMRGINRDVLPGRQGPILS